MTFPTVATTAPSTTTTAATTHVVTMPSGITAGDLLLIFIANGNNTVSTYSATGWTSILSNTAGLNGFAALYRLADGTEGASVTVNSTGTINSCQVALRITGWDGTTAPEIAGTGSTSSGSPDSPSLTPAGGALDYLWISAGFERTVTAISTYPTNYSGGQVTSGTAASTNIGQVAAAARQLNAASENPGAYSFAGTGAWYAATVAIKPATATTFNQTVSVTSTSAVTIGKGVAKSVAATSATAVSLLKSIGKKVAVASSISVAVTKAVSKAIAASSSSAVGVIKSVGKKIAVSSATSTLVSASRAFLVNIGVGVTTSVSLSKQVGKGVAAASSSSVAITKGVAKSIGVATTTAVSVTKRVAKTIAAAAATAVTVGIGRVYSVIVAVTSTTAVSLTRQIGKRIAIASTSAVSMRKAISKTVAVSTHISVVVAAISSVIKRAIRTLQVFWH